MIASIIGVVLVALFSYALGWEHGKRTMADRIRGPGQPCWRCDGSGKERPPGSVLR